MAREATGHTLQPTALVHEAWLRLVGDGDRTWQNRAYFFAAAAEAMRRILIEHARQKSRLKHGGRQKRLNIEDLELSDAAPEERILLVNEALERLEAEHPERAQIVVLKYFGGLTNKEAAETLGIGERTVDRHWVCAKTWLFHKIRAQM
jgi:RNA polymerase sigma factor (TIGR02999 family)